MISLFRRHTWAVYGLFWTRTLCYLVIWFNKQIVSHAQPLFLPIALVLASLVRLNMGGQTNVKIVESLIRPAPTLVVAIIIQCPWIVWWFLSTVLQIRSAPAENLLAGAVPFHRNNSHFINSFWQELHRNACYDIGSVQGSDFKKYIWMAQTSSWMQLFAGVGCCSLLQLALSLVKQWCVITLYEVVWTWTSWLITNTRNSHRNESSSNCK